MFPALPARLGKLHMIRLSILDQSPIRSGVTAADAVRETLELARFTDRLG